VDAQRRVEEERAEFAAKQQRIAETLQRSLLITPAAGRRPFAGLEVCPIYEPASDDMLVGGDFFDAFALPGGKTALVVGDMTGKGLDAAGRTAEIKFALRALLREHAGAPPALTLSLLNRHLVASEELDGRSGADVFACVALAVADPAAGTVALALAGMEPPLLLRAAAGGEPEPLDVGGVILGAIPDWDYGDGPAEFALLPGDVLMLFTDGLTEARRPHGELFGPARAASAVRDALTAGATLAEAGAAALEAARSFAGGRAQDDVCLLLARREESPIR